MLASVCVCSAFSVPPPVSVVFDRKQRLLHIVPPGDQYCARVFISDQTSAAVWHLYEACANLSDSRMLVKGEVATNFKVALCLLRRLDICGISVPAVKRKFSTYAI